MEQLVLTQLWAARMRDAGVPREVIDSLARTYQYTSLSLISALMSDDRLCGVGFATFGASPDCAIHDATMLCAKFGYPIATSEKTALELARSSTEIGLTGLRDLALWPFKVLVGAPVGWVIDRIRAARK